MAWPSQTLLGPVAELEAMCDPTSLLVVTHIDHIRFVYIPKAVMHLARKQFPRFSRGANEFPNHTLQEEK